MIGGDGLVSFSFFLSIAESISDSRLDNQLLKKSLADSGNSLAPTKYKLEPLPDKSEPPNTGVTLSFLPLRLEILLSDFFPGFKTFFGIPI